MYRKGDMRRKNEKNVKREREKRGGGGGGKGEWDDRDTDSERERNSNTVKKLLGQLHGTLPVCKNQPIKAALITYNN